MDITVHMIVRNGLGIAKFCLAPVIPFAKRVLVYVDSRSTDGTFESLAGYDKVFPNVTVSKFIVRDPKVNLVEMRNAQIAATITKWIWIVDSDEFYLPLSIEGLFSMVSDNNYAYAYPFWAVWDEKHLHKSTSKRPTLRIVKNLAGLSWEGTFGEERLCVYGIPLEPRILPYRYIHFTHIKKDDWRGEMKQERTVDGKFLTLIPSIIKPYVKTFFDCNLAKNK